MWKLCNHLGGTSVKNEKCLMISKFCFIAKEKQKSGWCNESWLKVCNCLCVCCVFWMHWHHLSCHLCFFVSDCQCFAHHVFFAMPLFCHDLLVVLCVVRTAKQPASKPLRSHDKTNCQPTQQKMFKRAPWTPNWRPLRWCAPNRFCCFTGTFPYARTVSLTPFLMWEQCHWCEYYGHLHIKI